MDGRWPGAVKRKHGCEPTQRTRGKNKNSGFLLTLAYEFVGRFTKLVLESYFRKLLEGHFSLLAKIKMGSSLFYQTPRDIALNCKTPQGSLVCSGTVQLKLLQLYCKLICI